MRAAARTAPSTVTSTTRVVVVVARLQAHDDAIERQDRRDQLTPFDEHDARTVDDLLEAEIVKLLHVIEPVHVDVGDRDVAVVLAHDRERRAHDRLGHAETGGDALRERRLAAPQLAREHDDIAGREARRDRRTDGTRLRGRTRSYSHVALAPTRHGASALLLDPPLAAPDASAST